MESMQQLQRKLETDLQDRPGVLGIGIGLNRLRNDYAFKVLVHDTTAAAGLPTKINGVEIIYEVTGPIKTR